MKNPIVLIRNAHSYDFGGGERFPVFVAKVLRKHNTEAIIVSRHDATREFAQSENITTIKGWWWSHQNWSGWRTTLIPVYLAWQLLLTCYYVYLFIKIRPSAVHIQSKDDFVSASLAAALTHTTSIWTDHADLKHILVNLTVWYKNPVGKLVYLAARIPSKITLVSKSELQEVSAHLPVESFIRRKLLVVYNGCEDVYLEYKHEKKASLITYVIMNRLVTDKGVGEAIASFITLNKKHPKTRLVIGGDGPERQHFEAQARNHPSISFIGHQKDPYVAISSSDVFLQPSYHEGFSVALVEASMLRMPIIATSVGGNVEIVTNEKTGLLVEPREEKSLFEAMERLYLDEGLRDQIAHEARRQYLDRFIFDNIVMNEFMTLYRGGLG